MALSPELRMQVAELTRKGNGHYDRGEYRQALEIFYQLLGFFPQEERESSEYAVVLGNIAAASAELGDLRNSRDFFHTALNLHRKLGEEQKVAIAHFNLGNVAKYANDWNGTIDNYEAAAEIFRRIGDRRNEALTRTSLGHFFLMFTTKDMAAGQLDKIELSPQEIDTWPNIGYSYRMLESHLRYFAGELEGALASARQALDHALSLGHASYIQEAKLAVARLTAHLGDSSALQMNLEEKYAVAKDRELRDLPEAAYALAKFLRERGETERALSLIEEALQVIDRRRGELFESRKSLLMERDFLYFAEHLSLLLECGRFSDAFASAERLQGRVLFERMFRHQIKRQGGRSMKVYGGSIEVAPPTFTDALELARRDRLYILRVLLLLDDQLAAWLITPSGELHSWDATEALTALKDLLESLPTTFFFEGLPTIDLSKGAEQIPERLPDSELEFRASSGSGSIELEALELFFKALFPLAVRTILAQSQGRLLVIPHQQLYQVPWCALLAEPGSPLGQRWQIAAIPSLAVYDQLDPRRDVAYHGKAPADDRTALVAGDCGEQSFLYPLFPNQTDKYVSLRFEALPGARQEAWEVADLLHTQALVGESFERGALYAELHRASVIHLATHGVWNPVVGELSFLLVSAKDGAHTPILSADEIRYRILRAELVVLSACQTGLGTPHPDSYLGLPGSFLIAGARTVLLSLWPVDDSATRLLMALFYQEIRNGASPSAALQSAQTVFQATTELADPYFWAGFQLMGRPFEPVWEKPPVEACDGPSFCGGDLILYGYPADQVLDLESMRDVHQRGYGESIVVVDGAVATRLSIPCPDDNLRDIWIEMEQA